MARYKVVELLLFETRRSLSASRPGNIGSDMEQLQGGRENLVQAACLAWCKVQTDAGRCSRRLEYDDDWRVGSYAMPFQPPDLTQAGPITGGRAGLAPIMQTRETTADGMQRSV